MPSPKAPSPVGLHIAGAQLLEDGAFSDGYCVEEDGLRLGQIYRAKGDRGCANSKRPCPASSSTDPLRESFFKLALDSAVTAKLGPNDEWVGGYYLWQTREFKEVIKTSDGAREGALQLVELMGEKISALEERIESAKLLLKDMAERGKLKANCQYCEEIVEFEQTTTLDYTGWMLLCKECGCEMHEVRG